MAPSRRSLGALLLLVATLCAAQGAVTTYESRYDAEPALSPGQSLSRSRLAGLLRRVVRAAEEEAAAPQQVVGDAVDEKSAADAGDDNAMDGEEEAAAAPPEVLVPASPAAAGEAAGRPRGHYHFHDKAGCFGYGNRGRPVIIVVNNNTPSDDSSGETEQLRAAPRSRRGRSRGRRSAPQPRLWLYSRPGWTPLAQRLGVPTEVLLPYAPQHKVVNDLEFNDLDHRKLESRLQDDGRERVKREAEEGDDNEVEEVPEPSILDYSIKDLVKRCVNSILGGGSGKDGSGGVSIARDGVAVGRAAVDGGIQVAKMIVQAFRELGASSSLVDDAEPSQQGLPALDAEALGAVVAEHARARRDAIQNVRKNLKTKADVIMSRTNDVGEKVNDKMDSAFGDNPTYVKAKEMIMGVVGKLLQGAAKVASSSSSRRRRAAAEENDTAKPPRPRKGMAAILARVLEDMDNIPGRRVAKMVSARPEPETLEDADEAAAKTPAGAQGEAADLLTPRREKRAAPASVRVASTETTTADLAAEGDATTEGWSEEEEDHMAESAAGKGGEDIGKELGVRRRRDVSDGAVRLKRDIIEDVRNATEKLMQRGREMFMKAKQAFEEAMRKAQEAAKGRSGAGAAGAAAGGPGASAAGASEQEKPADKKDMPESEKAAEMPPGKPDGPEELPDDAEQAEHSARRRSVSDGTANGIYGNYKTDVKQLTDVEADAPLVGEDTTDYAENDYENFPPPSSLNFLP